MIILLCRWSTELDSDLLIRGNVPGVITDVAVNRTDPEQNSMFVVGTFDSVRLKPTLRYCGVGEWSGHGLFRVIQYIDYPILYIVNVY